MQWVHFFKEGDRNSSALLGGKGASLAEMTRLGLTVPRGFIIDTAACNAYLENGRRFPKGLRDEVRSAVKALQQTTGKHFEIGHKFPAQPWPLLVSVRSGAPISMPGMLDTILNVGLTTERVNQYARRFGQPAFVKDLYNRLIRMYAHTVCNVSLQSHDTEQLLREFRERTGSDFPQDPYEQLDASIGAVFDSWLSPKAVQYRSAFHIPDNLGTAVIVQEMVFGNMGEDSGTGVLFTRDPASGAKRIFGEYLPNSQGEDLVSGLRTPDTIDALQRSLPHIYQQLAKIADTLERSYRDMQDIEFTVERGSLFILQTRAAKRTPMATIRVAVDMANENLITREDAVRRVEPSVVSQALFPRLADARPESAIASGIPSSPGATSGKVALTAEKARQLAMSGESVMFVRNTVSPDDVAVMPLIAGILTREGGATSHAAVVARGQGIPCIVGCSSIRIDTERNLLHIGQHEIPEGTAISIDGSTGLVFLGEQQLVSTSVEVFSELRMLLDWADTVVGGRPSVYVNANTPDEFRAICSSREGINAIGLVRTDWMFYDHQFRNLIREVLLGENGQSRSKALQRLEHLHSRAFEAIFVAVGEVPITVQLLSSPLDYFYPTRDPLLIELAESRVTGKRDDVTLQRERLLQAITVRQQSNPRFGVRGIRLFFTQPELATMQVRAIFTGLSRVLDKGIKPELKLLLPNVTAAAEIKHVAKMIREIATDVVSRGSKPAAYQLGALLETPRAALTAGEMVQFVDFLSVSLDGLTEAVFSFAHEDGGAFLPTYTANQIFIDPLKSFDEAGVGSLIRQAVIKVREAASDVPIGATGTLVDTIDALKLSTDLSLDYVSVDPSHANTARLKLAQLRLSEQRHAPIGRDAVDKYARSRRLNTSPNDR